MASDTELLVMSEKELYKVIEDGLRTLENKPQTLYLTRLANSSLIVDCLLQGELLNSTLQAIGTKSLLRWLIDCLRPIEQGKSDAELWLDPQWRSYLVLASEYFLGMKTEQIAYKLQVEPKTMFKFARTPALLEVVTIFRHELYTKQNHQLRKKYSVIERYRALAQPAQSAIAFAATFRHALLSDDLQALWQQAAIKDVYVEDLLRSGLLIRQDATNHHVQVHPEVRTLLVEEKFRT